MTATAAEPATINGIFGFARRRLSHSEILSGLQSHSSRTSWLIMDGVIGKVEQDSLPVSKLEKLTLPLFVLSFFYPPINPFLLLFSAFVLLTYW